MHVFAYEYPGYGPSKGTPNDLEILFGIQEAYHFLTERLKIKWHQIILYSHYRVKKKLIFNIRYGRSIGTGPSLYLASHPKFPVSGVILHSPLASGLRLMDLNVNSFPLFFFSQIVINCIKTSSFFGV